MIIPAIIFISSFKNKENKMFISFLLIFISIYSIFFFPKGNRNQFEKLNTKNFVENANLFGLKSNSSEYGNCYKNLLSPIFYTANRFLQKVEFLKKKPKNFFCFFNVIIPQNFTPHHFLVGGIRGREPGAILQ